MWTDEALTGEQVLAHREFEQAGSRGVPPRTGAGQGGVSCGHPLVYPIEPADLPPTLRGRAALGRRFAGAVFAFDLDVLPDGARYTGARFEVRLSTAGARAIQLAQDGDELGLVQTEQETLPASAVAARAVAAARTRPGLLRRFIARRDAPRAWTTGVQSGAFGWVFNDPRGRLLLPRTYALHALLEIPEAAAELTGSLSVQVEVDGGLVRSPAVTFREAFGHPAQTQPFQTQAAVRLCVAADVVGYSRRGNIETERLQSDLVDVLARARRAAGIEDHQVDPQKQGDGQFTVLPVGIDESAVIPALLGELGRQLAGHQHMQLRVALHRGLVKEAANGWVGDSAIAVHRVLDSAPLRRAIAENPGIGYALGVPDVLYRDVIAHADRPPLPADFQAITVDLPAKNFIEHGWLYLGQRS